MTVIQKGTPRNTQGWKKNLKRFFAFLQEENVEMEILNYE